MPKQLNNGAVTQALQRAFGFKGRYIPMLDEVIVPVYIIADPSPAGVTRLAAGTASAIVALGNTTNLPFVQLFNPVDSGVVINVTSVAVLSDVKETMLVSMFDGVAPDDDGNIAFRDRRNTGVPAGQVRADSVTGGLAVLGTFVAVLEVDGALSQTAAWESQASDPRQPLVVLGEGQSVAVQGQTPATGGANSPSVRVNFRWLEIPQTEVRPAGGLP